MHRSILAAEEPPPVLPLPGEMIVGAVAFLILLLVLWKFAVPRFEALYEERTAAIEGGMKRAEEMQAEAKKLKEQYEEQMAGARAERARILDDARAEGAEIKAAARTQAEEEAARIVARGESQVAASRDSAERNLRGQVGGLSVQLAERLLGSSLADDARRSSTIDGFLAELDGASGNGAGRSTAKAT